MFEKPRCTCPRCTARRRSRYLVIFAVCAAIVVGYFAMTEYPQAVPDLSLQGNEGPADKPSSDLASIAGENSGSVSTEIAQSSAQERAQIAVIADNHREPSTPVDASLSVQNKVENRPISDGDLQLAIHPSSNPVTDSPAPETSPQPVKKELSSRELAATSPGENLAMVYSSDPYGLLPLWLTKGGLEIPRKLHPALTDESKSVVENQESPILGRGPNGQEASAAVSDPKRATSQTAEPARQRDPENGRLAHHEDEDVSQGLEALCRDEGINVETNAIVTLVKGTSGEWIRLLGTRDGVDLLPSREASATAPVPSLGQIPDPTETRAHAAAVAPSAPEDSAPPLAGTKAAPENSKPAEKAIDPGSRSKPRPPASLETGAWKDESGDKSLETGDGAPVSENKASAAGNASKGAESKLGGSLVSLGAVRESGLLKDALPQERREPQDYILVKSRPESLQSGAERNHSLRPQERRPKTVNDPVQPQNDPPKPQDYPSKSGDDPAKSHDGLTDLQRFASDFVRTIQIGNVEDQHRFYADSVHFYGEGDLSWAGVAAATRRYHQEKRNTRYEGAGPAFVKGPVNGGFYVIDQPVSWSRTDGSRLTRGRTMLHLRVIPTGRGSWKITSIEKVGQ
jgi:hypothetical protein